MRERKTHVGRSEHVLGVDEGTEEPHELHGSAQLGIRVADHLLYHQIYQQNILKTHTRVKQLHLLIFRREFKRLSDLLNSFTARLIYLLCLRNHSNALRHQS